MRFRPRNTAWLAALGVLLAVVAIAGVASAQVIMALLALYLAAAAASVFELDSRRLRDSVPASPLTRMRMSPQAREAVERARRRTNYAPAGLTLLDVGLITLHSSSEGMLMRRSRTVSLDDNGVRPYMTLHVAPESADRHALIRYEILDADGQVQFVHEMKTYLRDGEMNILADHHLPLAGNERLSSAGEWDLRVFVDGGLLGALSFTMSPSLEERRRQFAREQDEAASRLREVEVDDVPVSLEDLLRSRSRDKNQ
ncbi:MAG: hypothetical protein HZC41_06230 [Chloroflexi bacterium]|nr:hypothetical protein [Chloroflexota bacterium]